MQLFYLLEETHGKVYCTFVFCYFCCYFDLLITITTKRNAHRIYQVEITSSQVFLAEWVKKRFSFLQDICKYRSLFTNYRNTSCVLSSFFLTLFVSSVCWWTDFTEELIEKMPRAILSENFSRIFYEVHALVMTFWYIRKAKSNTKTSLWHLPLASFWCKMNNKDSFTQGTAPRWVDWAYSY